MSAEKELIEVHWVYAGKRIFRDVDSGEVLGDCWYAMKDGVADTSDKKLFTPKKRSGIKRLIGGIYALQASPDGVRAVTGGATWTGTRLSGTAAAEWRLQSDADEARMRLKRMEKDGKAEGIAGLLPGLDPLRAAYNKAWSREERIAMELMILSYIRGDK